MVVVLSSKSATDVLIRLATFQVFVDQDIVYLRNHVSEDVEAWGKSLAPYCHVGESKSVELALIRQLDTLISQPNN